MTNGRNRARPPGPDWPTRVRRLEDEVAGLRRGQHSRGLIEQAKGRLSERLGVDPEQAFEYLAQLSQQANVRVADLVADIATGQQLEAPARRVVQVRAGLSAVAAAEDLVDVLDKAAGLGADVIALFLAEADGALRLVAARGWSARLRSDWRWIPSAVRTPAGEAVRRAEPVWVEEASELALIGPGRVRVAVPLCVDGSAVGAVELVWHQPTEPDRAAVVAAADAVARRLAVGWETDDAAEPAAGPTGRWLEAVVDALAFPALLLSPLWTDGVIEDFSIDHANDAALAAWPAGALGRRLLDVDPRRLTDGTFDALTAAYESTRDTTGPAGGLGAARVGRQLVATWPAAVEDVPSAGQRVETMERLARLGWGEWSRDGQPVVCSPGLTRILGRTEASRPLALDELVDAVVAPDRAKLADAVAAARQATAPEPVDVRLRRPDGGACEVRVVFDVRLDQRGRTRTVLALVQDRTEARQREDAVTSTARQLGAQRVRAAVERVQVEQLRTTFFPAPWLRGTHGPLRIVARHAAPGQLQSFRGDFYAVDDVSTDEGGPTTVVAVGDVFGSGVAAAHAMVRLRHGVRMLGSAGVAPAAMLGLLNRDLTADEPPPLASLVVAMLAADGRSLTWAQAGAYSPILVRGGRARSLRRPRGDLLGLLPTTRYAEAAVALEPADVLVFFTDGVFQRWPGESSPTRRLASECLAAVRAGGAEALIERLQSPESQTPQDQAPQDQAPQGQARQNQAPADDEACLVAIEWPTGSP